MLAILTFIQYHPCFLHLTLTDSIAIKTKNLFTVRSTRLEPETQNADDSDYYTPEDPAPTILSPLYDRVSSLESTPQRHRIQSLPGTPVSHVSTRSSGDSYSSSGSTRHLLAVLHTNAQDRSVHIQLVEKNAGGWDTVNERVLNLGVLGENIQPDRDRQVYRFCLGSKEVTI